VNKVPDTQVYADLDSTVAWAATSGKGDINRLGVTGFCWGGRKTWLYAAHNPGVKAGVAWYGTLAAGRYPVGAIDLAPKIKAPVLGLYGGADTGIPLDTVEQMRKALKDGGNTKSEIVVYPDAPHAFHADYRPTYRKEAAEDGWKRCVAWFKANGVA
jgi:carboxymethylenebutenolidase